MISIIIPSFNRYADLERCLLSIRSQKFSNYEIIVIDDNSDDPLYELIDDGDVYLKNRCNYGPSYSRNTAALKARGSIFLFLDSDSELLPGALAYIFDLLINNLEIGCLGGCGPASPEGADVLYIKGKHYDGWGRNRSVKYTAQDFASTDLITCDHFESACLAVRREVLYETGGFDPYWFYMGEDRELCLRVRGLGYRNVIAWKARALHHEKDLCDKISQERQAFFLKRFFEVAVKLGGLRGGLKWLHGNRQHVDRRFVFRLLRSLPNLCSVWRRRGQTFIDDKSLREYRRSVDEH